MTTIRSYRNLAQGALWASVEASEMAGTGDPPQSVIRVIVESRSGEAKVRIRMAGSAKMPLDELRALVHDALKEALN